MRTGDIAWKYSVVHIEKEAGTEVEISLFTVKYSIKNWILNKLVVVEGRRLGEYCGA